MSSLIDAVKMAYRKHNLNDDSIGWGDLDECLLNALCNELGDDGFQEWLRSVGQEPHASKYWRVGYF